MRRTAPAFPSGLFAATPGALALASLLFAATALAQGAMLAEKTAGPAPAFHQVDADHSGRVSLDEVLAYAKQQRETKPFALKDVDKDGDGLVTQEELRRAGITGLEGFGSIRAQDLDRNGDGYVSHEDLDNYLNTRHSEAYTAADEDKDGSLKASEFVLFRFK